MKALSSALVGALALLVLAVGTADPVVAAESTESASVAEVPADALSLVAGPEFNCNNCYNTHFTCEEGGLYLTWQYWGPEDARVLQVQGTPDCYDTDKLCHEIIQCSEDTEWDAESEELAKLLEQALDDSDYASAARLVKSNPQIGTFVADRGVVIVRASKCVGGVSAVVSVDETFALEL